VGYVRTSDEIARIEAELSAPRWTGQWLAVQFLTDPETHRRLLPPPLTPAAEPLATVTVGRWVSSCLGDFAGGVLNFAAEYGGVAGSYVLVIYMTAEPAMTFGRELFGEPKKLATTGLECERDRLRGWVERGGVRLIDIAAELDIDQGPSQMERYTYNYKARTAASGHGLEEDAILTRTHFRVSLRTERIGTGTIALTGTVHDPLDEVEVVEVLQAVYAEEVVRATCAPVATIPAHHFLPYHYGRQDDWTAMNTMGVPA
jgi:acetoacetate decarboxylase